MSEAPAFDADIEYPTSDGRPVAETPLHYRRLADAAHALTTLFDSQASVYVGVNMLVYDEPGNPKRHLSPDIFIAFGVEDRYRTYTNCGRRKPRVRAGGDIEDHPERGRFARRRATRVGACRSTSFTIPVRST